MGRFGPTLFDDVFQFGIKRVRRLSDLHDLYWPFNYNRYFPKVTRVVYVSVEDPIYSVDVVLDDPSTQATAFRRCRSTLFDAMTESDIPSLTNRLYSFDVITQHARQAAEMTTRHPAVRKTGLLNAIEARIRADSEKFDTLLEVLRSDSFSHVADKMQKKYDDLNTSDKAENANSGEKAQPRAEESSTSCDKENDQFESFLSHLRRRVIQDYSWINFENTSDEAENANSGYEAHPHAEESSTFYDKERGSDIFFGLGEGLSKFFEYGFEYHTCIIIIVVVEAGLPLIHK